MQLNSIIDNPQQLRELPVTALNDVCTQLRDFIIDHVSANGGHFSSSLGVIELTVALHYIFNTPVDKLVWDVGHQAYAHKLLTGRRSVFPTNRLLNGISGFPCRSESEYDAFGTGHSSTSISAVLGMAVAARYRNDHTRQHIAVIGDGAMTAGQAFEALNNAGAEKANVLIILNDNDRSIDPNVGALKEYLADLTSSALYNKMRLELSKLLQEEEENPSLSKKMIRKLEKTIKSGILPYSNFFEALNIRYFGPVDGHDLGRLTKILKKLKDIPGPKLLHCVTVKGKGYAPAVNDQTKWHSPGAFDKITGISKEEKRIKPPKYQEVFGRTLLELAEQNPLIMGITPAMASGSALDIMMKVMPDRVFDVGISEQHAVTFSAGLAADGMIPFCTIYSTFLQRAYDQVIHDVALQELPVILCIDRAGVVGTDGPTHHGAFDIAYLRCIPNLIGAAPMDETELRNLLYTAQSGKVKSPFAIRYPKGNCTQTEWKTPFSEVVIGKGRKIRSGENIAILSLGQVGNYAIEACEQLMTDDIYPAHYDLRFFKPLDHELLHEVFRNFEHIITVEDGCIAGGAGSAVIEFMVKHGYQAKVQHLGLTDTFAVQGSPEQLHALYNYDAFAIQNAVKSVYKHAAQSV